MTAPTPARWPARGRRAGRVVVVVLLALFWWISCVGTEVWSWARPVHDAELAGVWTGPGEATMVLSADGIFRARHLPASAFGGGRAPQLDGVDGRWTREPREFGPDPILVRFADPPATELLIDVRRSWRGQAVLVLWTSRCVSCRQVPVTFARMP